MKTPPPSSPTASPARPAASGWAARLGLDEAWVEGRLSSRLFLTLRWLAVVGQGTTLLAADRIGVAIPWAACLPVLAVTFLSNLAMEWWRRERGGELGSSLFQIALWDVFALTALLHGTGGLGNPFAIFYLVQLTVVTVSLRSEGIAGLSLGALAACVYLWLQSTPMLMKDGVPVPSETLALGRLLALALSGATVLLLVLAVRRASRAAREEKRLLHRELANQERFLSVATLATGFAHEMATPLATISIAASELARDQGDDSPSALIRNEAARCEAILARLRSVGNEALEGSAPPVDLATLIEEALAQLPPEQRERVRVYGLGERPGSIRSAGLREALLVLLRNALQSSPPDAPVELTCAVDPGEVRFRVSDDGTGFDAETLRRWGEPFLTTRSDGLGLGLFFVRRLVSAAGGTMEIANRPDGGASVRLCLPRGTAPPKAS